MKVSGLLTFLIGLQTIGDRITMKIFMNILLGFCMALADSVPGVSGWQNQEDGER